MDQVKTGMGGLLYGVEANGIPEERIRAWALKHLKKGSEIIHKQQCFPIQIEDLTVTDLVEESNGIDIHFTFSVVYKSEVFEESPIHRWVEECFQNQINVYDRED